MICQPTAKELGAFLRRSRLAAGMTQSELGREVGIANSEICRYENGRCTPSAATWLHMLTVLDAPNFSLRTEQTRQDKGKGLG